MASIAALLLVLTAVSCDSAPTTSDGASPQPSTTHPSTSQPSTTRENTSDTTSDASPKPPTNPPAPSDAARGSSAGARPTSFADVVARVRPAVVNLYTRKEVVTHRDRQPFSGRQLVPRRRVAESLGSGFIIDPGGLVLTNNHVVADATDIGVRLFDDRFFRARIVGADPKTDVALLEIKSDHPQSLPSLPMGDAGELRVGDWVVAIGNPLGLTSTVTAGIASAIGRQGIPINQDMRYQDFIQTDASINPGNSGGPLITTAGKVVGINTAISARGQGIGFAIPINTAAEILPQLKQSGHVERSWLGVYVDKIPRKLHDELGLADDTVGARITRVVAGGPADKAGLRRGDILLRLDDHPIEDAAHLAWKTSNLGVGNTITLGFWRRDGRQTTTLTLGVLPD